MPEHLSPFLRGDSHPAGSQGRMRCDGFLTSCCWHGHWAASCLPWGCRITRGGKEPCDKEGPTSVATHCPRRSNAVVGTEDSGCHTWLAHLGDSMRKARTALDELEAICPKCESPGLDLCCVSLPAHEEENGQVSPPVSRLWPVCSCCPQRCGHPSLRPGVHGRRLRREGLLSIGTCPATPHRCRAASRSNCR